MWRVLEELTVVPAWLARCQPLPTTSLLESLMITTKRYRCTRCGHLATQQTNHFGPTWSWNRRNVCPTCPPYAKYPEFGGMTNWECIDKEAELPDAPGTDGDPLA